MPCPAGPRNREPSATERRPCRRLVPCPGPGGRRRLPGVRRRLLGVRGLGARCRLRRDRAPARRSGLGVRRNLQRPRSRVGCRSLGRLRSRLCCSRRRRGGLFSMRNRARLARFRNRSAHQSEQRKRQYRNTKHWLHGLKALVRQPGSRAQDLARSERRWAIGREVAGYAGNHSAIDRFTVATIRRNASAQPTASCDAQ